MHEVGSDVLVFLSDNIKSIFPKEYENMAQKDDQEK